MRKVFNKYQASTFIKTVIQVIIHVYNPPQKSGPKGRRLPFTCPWRLTPPSDYVFMTMYFRGLTSLDIQLIPNLLFKFHEYI